ncbi:PAS domain-containing sensor histidine kinase [uncultured Sphingomonas sp.]|uniref:sensor histidine kinase n=1 Tax=uncultured Sphingomonas sp. TaxID=158754 RepID=UPI0025F2EABA|nr:PAS domain-containing sensor histidine kinase [uncultured Sphingomonas sp.]
MGKVRERFSLDARGALIGVIVSGVLLTTERAVRRRTLRTQRGRDMFEAVMRSSAGAVMFLDGDMRILRASTPAAEMLGISQSGLAGRPVGAMLVNDIHPGDGQPISSDAAPALIRNTAHCGEGRRLPVETQLFGLADGDVRWMLRIYDRSMNDMERLKAEFVSTVSHELRTPLSSIAGALGLVAAGATGELPADAGEMVGIALNNTQRLMRLINDLLDIERLQLGKLHFEMQPHSLRWLIGTAVDEIGPFADQHRIQLVIDDAGGQDCVVVDADRMGQVLSNLLSNAIKFSPEGSLVKVALRPSTHFHRVEVIDNGQGIAPEFRPLVFAKFAQGDASGTRKVGGTGLGLAISREIVDRLDGKLWFSDNPEGGTIFSLDLPAGAHAAEQAPAS